MLDDLAPMDRAAAEVEASVVLEDIEYEVALLIKSCFPNDANTSLIGVD